MFYPRVRLQELRVLGGCSEYVYCLLLSQIWRSVPRTLPSASESLRWPSALTRRTKLAGCLFLCLSALLPTRCMVCLRRAFLSRCRFSWWEQRAQRRRLRVPHPRLELCGKFPLHLGYQVHHVRIHRVSFCFSFSGSLQLSWRVVW